MKSREHGSYEKILLAEVFLQHPDGVPQSTTQSAAEITAFGEGAYWPLLP